MNNSHLISDDTFEILPKIPDQSVDCVLTDIPYDLDRLQIGFLAVQFLRVCRGHILVFCAPENQFPSPRYLFWVKPTSTKNFSKSHGRFVEMIAWIRQGSTFNQLFWANMTGVYHDVVRWLGNRLGRHAEYLLAPGKIHIKSFGRWKLVATRMAGSIPAPSTE